MCQIGNLQNRFPIFQIGVPNSFQIDVPNSFQIDVPNRKPVLPVLQIHGALLRMFGAFL